METMVVYAVKVIESYYISAQIGAYSRVNLEPYYFDGVKPRPSFDTKWYIIDKPPTAIHVMKPQPDINHRYVLIDDSLISDTRPEVIMREEACYQASCGDWIWKDEYAQYKSLYLLFSDKQPDIDVEIPFDWQVLGEAAPFLDPADYKYPAGRVWRSYSAQYEDTYISNREFKHQEIDNAIFPSFMLHTKPCKLSQKDASALIREHVRQNINPQHAAVDWDTDYRFRVVKLITLAKPYESDVQHKPIGGRKSITKRIMNVERKRVIYETKEERGKWSDIPEFEGKDERDLAECIDTYLENLMAEINEPIIECPVCHGTGVKQG